MTNGERQRTMMRWWLTGIGILLSLVLLISIAEFVFIRRSDPHAFTPVLRYEDLRVCGEDEPYKDADGVPMLAFCRSVASTPTADPHE